MPTEYSISGCLARNNSIFLGRSRIGRTVVVSYSVKTTQKRQALCVKTFLGSSVIEERLRTSSSIYPTAVLSRGNTHGLATRVHKRALPFGVRKKRKSRGKKTESQSFIFCRGISIILSSIITATTSIIPKCYIMASLCLLRLCGIRVAGLSPSPSAPPAKRELAWFKPSQ